MCCRCRSKPGTALSRDHLHRRLFGGYRHGHRCVVALAIMISNDMVSADFPEATAAGAAEPRERFCQDTAAYPTHRDLRRAGARLCVFPLRRQHTGLAKIGLLSFAAICANRTRHVRGLIWRRANARGAIAGLTSGFLVWAYLLFLPSLARTITPGSRPACSASCCLASRCSSRNMPTRW